MTKPTANYDDWCRAVFDAAHHDIWWVKEQQMSAGNWTLLLLGALVGVNQLLAIAGQTPTDTQTRLLGLASSLVVGLGGYYVWDLYLTMVRSRRRAKAIVALVDDPHGIFTESKRDPKRHWGFPVAITGVFVVAWAITLWLFSFLGSSVWLPPVALWLTGNAWGLWRRSKLNGETSMVDFKEQEALFRQNPQTGAFERVHSGKPSLRQVLKWLLWDYGGLWWGGLGFLLLLALLSR